MFEIDLSIRVSDIPVPVCPPGYDNPEYYFVLIDSDCRDPNPVADLNLSAVQYSAELRDDLLKRLELRAECYDTTDTKDTEILECFWNAEKKQWSEWEQTFTIPVPSTRNFTTLRK